MSSCIDTTIRLYVLACQRTLAPAISPPIRGLQPCSLKRPAGGALAPGVEPSLGAPEPPADGRGSAPPGLAPLVPDVPPRSTRVVDAVPGVGVIGRAERGPATDPVRTPAERVELRDRGSSRA